MSARSTLPAPVASARKAGAGRRALPPALAAAFALATLLGGAAEAANAPPPMKPRPSGLECRAAVAQYGGATLWVGKFAGRRDRDDIRIPNAISVWRCFTNEKDCRNWLYWMMSDFSSWQWVSRCDHGYAP